ncbi:hypothetical protein R1flu_023808 [Riccia fluitans]|uniref:Uncharacterized protein n=1 Tax=Riccia fluitans TaxID=41844 RepID=A0ABD1XW24_9MARC
MNKQDDCAVMLLNLVGMSLENRRMIKSEVMGLKNFTQLETLGARQEFGELKSLMLAQSSRISILESEAIEATSMIKGLRGEVTALLREVKILGSRQGEERSTMQVIAKSAGTLTDQLKGVGIKGDLSGPIIVKFVDQQQKDKVMANKSILKRQHIWIDPDLTPLQMEQRRHELIKVKEATAAGFVAYSRNGLAVVMQDKRAQA